MRDWYPHPNARAKRSGTFFIFGMFRGYEEETVKIFMKLVINNFCKVVI